MRFSWLPVSVLLCTGFAQAQVVQSTQGQVEIQDSTWQPLSRPGPLLHPLRTLLGRADLKVTGGRFLLGSHSTARPRNQEVQLLSGQGYAEGSFTFFLGRTHVFLNGKARLDITDTGARISVLQGLARLSSPGRPLFHVPENKTYHLTSRSLQDFQEDDAWYKNELLGVGTLQVAAQRGTVEIWQDPVWQKLQVNRKLQLNDTVKTGQNSWAEFSFEDGSYFRLNARSQVRVLSMEKLSGGQRRVVLKLEQGTAWNVVQKGRGGYQFRTATLVAGVRGTTFRLDADGSLKVLEGTVVASSENRLLAVQQGQAWMARQGPIPLQLDSVDRFNQHLDSLHNTPLTIDLEALPSTPLQAFVLRGKTLPGTQLHYSASQHTGFIEVGDDGRFMLELPLPDGEHFFTFTAQRDGKETSLSGTVVVQRYLEPPIKVEPTPVPAPAPQPVPQPEPEPPQPAASVELIPASPVKVVTEVVPAPEVSPPLDLKLHLEPLEKHAVKQATLRGQATAGSTLWLELSETRVQVPLEATGRFEFPLDLPDGMHTFTLRLTQQNSEYAVSGWVHIDRTPPKVRKLVLERQGNGWLLDAEVEDATPVTLQALGNTVLLDGSKIRLPIQEGLTQLEVVLQDEAGNTTTTQVPLP